jgi:hypothetical protein
MRIDFLFYTRFNWFKRQTGNCKETVESGYGVMLYKYNKSKKKRLCWVFSFFFILFAEEFDKLITFSVLFPLHYLHRLEQNDLFFL